MVLWLVQGPHRVLAALTIPLYMVSDRQKLNAPWEGRVGRHFGCYDWIWYQLLMYFFVPFTKTIWFCVQISPWLNSWPLYPVYPDLFCTVHACKTWKQCVLSPRKYHCLSRSLTFHKFQIDTFAGEWTDPQLSIIYNSVCSMVIQ